MDSMSDTAQTRLFVYGSLAPGRSNAHVLGPLPGSWEPAKVEGLLIPEGCELSYGYPALILNSKDPDAGEVSGLLFSSPALPDFWPELDEFEGEGYRRVITSVTTDAGEVCSAYTYELNTQ